ncbi:ABC transporter permease [Bosea sp. (in: a-proteobacteria)]|uniref:ABC transporter permease n=1 Tax=Bosea sp. (in: a-proteobacteria) TaxID=1871050 RepID=UPI00261ADAB1|nr:ABC transporter permease [Bosea sp. (in: a-proteobacteria)]MCO5093588.1 ABC transporter permease [Bosea sp. (in: a-proteobacteria)]
MNQGGLSSFLRKLLHLVPVVIAIASLNFVLLKLAPGDAADILGGMTGSATVEYLEQLRRELGLDQPVWLQYVHYMKRMLTLDLGMSAIQGVPVIDLILQRLPATLILMLAALVIAVFCGVLAGVTAARFKGSWIDNLTSVLALVIYATPQFWLGLMLIVLFSITLGLLPSGGMMRIGVTQTPLSAALDIAHHLILPAVTLGLFYMAVYARLMRASMLEVLSLDYISTARAKGLSESKVTWRHAFRNALLPVVTLIGIQVGHLLGGSILVETVFGWPGLGRLIFDALLQRDTDLLLGILFISSVSVVLVSLIVDLIYGLLDPRSAVA